MALPPTSDEWWTDGPPSSEHPLATLARPVHFALFPISVLLASVEIWTEALEAVLGDEGYTSISPRSGGVGRLGFNPYAILLALLHVVMATLPLLFNLIQLALSDYPGKQATADKLEDDGGAMGVYQPTQLAIAFLARFGPWPAHLGMLLLGGVPSGATEKKPTNDPLFRHVSLGSGSAFARAFARGEARTVAFFLHAAPDIEYDGSFFSTQVLPPPTAGGTGGYVRHVEQWVAAERNKGERLTVGHIGWGVGPRTRRSHRAACLGALIDVVLIALITIASWRHPCDVCGGMAVREMSIEAVAGFKCLDEIDGEWRPVGMNTAPWAVDGYGFTDEARCVSTDPRFEVRLNGRDAVEIYHRGEWKYVCDDSWDINDANVVCRQLGLGSAVSAPKRIQIPTSSFWLDDLRCEGDEAHLGDCPHRGWGSHNCGTGEGAGARCNGTYTASPPPPPPPPRPPESGGDATNNITTLGSRRLQTSTGVRGEYSARRWESFTCEDISNSYATMARPDPIGLGLTTCAAVQSFYQSPCCTSALALGESGG